MGKKNRKIKNVLFLAMSGGDWIGGLYYVKNMIYTLNIDHRDDINAILLVSSSDAHLFSGFKKLTIVEVNVRFKLLRKIINMLLILFFKRSFNIDVFRSVKRHSVDYIFPVLHFPFLFAKNKCIGWIPDFQEVHYPELFNSVERRYRLKKTHYYAEHLVGLLLSSKSAADDLKSIVSDLSTKVRIVPFVSNIESHLQFVTVPEFGNKTREKYGISRDYFIVCNQFWRHKNHKVVFEALSILQSSRLARNFSVVFTGSKFDYRDTGFIKSLFMPNRSKTDTSAGYDDLVAYAENHGFLNKIEYLGLIDRSEQLALMYGSLAVIQPSLFEGWGTVVEDAKVLDCEILLSDIPVHREQMHGKAFLFPPNEPQELARLMGDALKKTDRGGNFIEGLREAKSRAEIYSAEFISLLND